ncbi:class I SAM-dependent methyltransferase [Frondihabitans sp. VKM Ac-2883]|uniref:class I SAM-dependent methyltransferase n=1 Tax=Frondihabitans sp. VKM Ac-2883 TaxID=2783823 RepID=UPI00188DB5A7|nr:class I SAM-dependent methyltransferase [Frondihabitans sp. VKM Ac-2883]MBF4574864.1 class I SAM-dependent methyltransferase [Frondihabitans sp. VKM Ac-2883]
MESSELRELLTPEGLRLLDSLPPFDQKADVVSQVARLRKAGHSPELVAAVLGQSRLRAKGRTKFGDFAERMLFTEAGLEQATRLAVASTHAGRFRRAGVTRVADLGCGIGGDALAFAALELGVLAVDRDEVTAAVATYNLAPWSGAEVRLGDAEQVDLAGVDGVFLDPARRTAGHANTSRIQDPSQWSPTLDTAFAFASRFPTGVKLGPGVDRDLLPTDAECQWISVDRSVVEVGVWFGALARPGVGRAALVFGPDGPSEMTAPGDSDDVDVAELSEYVYEPDGAVIRARLIGDLARALNAHTISRDIAYLSSATARATPFAQCFRVIETFPLDEKRLRQELKTRGIGRVEIKKRGVDVDPAAFRKKLQLKGANEATLILTRVAGRHTALLCERVVAADLGAGA